MNKRQKIHELVMTGLLFAIIVVMTVIPNVGFINIGLVSITLLHIPTIIGGITVRKRYALILGAAFGIGSFIQAFYYLGGNAPFTNPLVSVLPRVLLPLFASFLYRAFAPRMKEGLALPLTFFLSTLFHTVLVLSLYYVCGATGFYFYAATNAFTTSFLTVVMTILSLNTLVEALAATVIGSLIVFAIEKSQKIKNFLPEVRQEAKHDGKTTE